MREREVVDPNITRANEILEKLNHWRALQIPDSTMSDEQRAEIVWADTYLLRTYLESEEGKQAIKTIRDARKEGVLSHSLYVRLQDADNTLSPKITYFTSHNGGDFREEVFTTTNGLGGAYMSDAGRSLGWRSIGVDEAVRRTIDPEVGQRKLGEVHTYIKGAIARKVQEVERLRTQHGRR